MTRQWIIRRYARALLHVNQQLVNGASGKSSDVPQEVFALDLPRWQLTGDFAKTDTIYFVANPVIVYWSAAR
jgi:hypothetical protein